MFLSYVTVNSTIAWAV